MQSDDLVVPCVDQEKIRFVRGAISGNGQNHVRIYAAHGGINDLELDPGILVLEHHFQDPPKTERRLRRPHGRRFSEDENADRSGVLFRRHQKKVGARHIPR